jgi:hypothetical protein
MKTLFLAWQAPASRLWYPVGRLDADQARAKYEFQYLMGARKAERDGFHPISAFPRIDEHYCSTELFPLFENRVINRHRRGFAEYVESLGMDAGSVDPLEILSVTGGERQTDNFEVFPKLIKSADNRFECRFFLHGLRHCSGSARMRALALQPGEYLRISVELNNPATRLAVQLLTQDYEMIGWAPKYLVLDLLGAAADFPELTARVVRNNAEGTPLNRRVLIELSGTLPEGLEPMSGEDFDVIPAVSRH